jgi:hypothetical protein
MEKIWGQMEKIWGQMEKIWGQMENLWGQMENLWGQIRTIVKVAINNFVTNEPTNTTSKYVKDTRTSPVQDVKKCSHRHMEDGGICKP